MKKRKAVSDMERYINANLLVKILTTAQDGTRIPYVNCDNFPITVSIRELKRVIRKMPTADVVEVVRCKDCKHFKTDTDYCKEHNRGYCEFDNIVKDIKHFCSFGERMNDEEE